MRERSTRVRRLDKSEETRIKDALDNATSPGIENTNVMRLLVTRHDSVMSGQSIPLTS